MQHLIKLLYLYYLLIYFIIIAQQMLHFSLTILKHCKTMRIHLIWSDLYLDCDN